MSYILDALKKSERERQRGTVPDPLTEQDFIPEKPKGRAFWPYLIMGALLLNAVIFAFAAFLLNSDKAITKTPPDKMYASKTNNPLSPPAPTAAKGESEVRPKAAHQLEAGANANKADTKYTAKTMTVQPKESKSASVPAKPKNGTNKAVSETKMAHNVKTPVLPEPKPNKDIAPPIKNKIYRLNELPVPVRQNLPPISISVFVYSEDADSRMVRINGQMMREGQHLAAGLKLEKIFPDSVIFNYQNYRFSSGSK